MTTGAERIRPIIIAYVTICTLLTKFAEQGRVHTQIRFTIPYIGPHSSIARSAPTLCVGVVFDPTLVELRDPLDRRPDERNCREPMQPH